MVESLQAPSTARPRRGATRLPVCVKVAILVTLLVVLGGCQLLSPTVPAEWLGEWTTVDARYADRFFEITPTSILFGVGEGKVEAYPIVAVEEVREQDAVFHTISYRNQDGQGSRLSFYYDPRDAGVIRFKHQRTIEWTKVRS